MERIFDFKWQDMLAVISKNYSSPYKSLTADILNDAIYNYLYSKYCLGCHNERKCHDECVHCDDMRALLERMGFEV